MTARLDLEQRLRGHFEAHADRTVVEGQLDAIAIRTATVRQRPAWLAVLANDATDTFSAIRWSAIAPIALPSARVLVAAAVLVALLIAALLLAGRPAPLTGWIVYGARDRAGAPVAIHVVRADGTGDRVVRPESHERAFWSADGRRLGFNDGFANADGTGFTPIDTVQGALLVSAWDWSADGGSLLVQGSSASTPGQNGVYLQPLRGDEALVQVTHYRPAHGANAYGRLVPAAMSPDNQAIAFVALRGHDLEGRLMVVGSDGQHERRVGDLLVAIGPTWSPDGTSLLAASSGSLVQIDLDTGTATTIAGPSELGGELLGGVFAPDGRHILVRSRAPGGTVGLYVTEADGGRALRIASSAAEVAFADWGQDPTPR